MTRYIHTALAAAACFIPGASLASSLGGDSDDFSQAQAVSDEELATMRGGFINARGMLIDFGFMSRAVVGDTVQQAVSISSSNIAQTLAGGGSIQNAIPPVIIQNANNNVRLAVEQVLDLTVQGAANLQATQSQLNQSNLQSALALR